MKRLLLNIINWKLGLVAKYTLIKHNPKVIGITGSVGKTSTKNAIYTVLRQSGASVRMGGGNLNNETGLPLAILGNYKASGGLWFLSKALWRGFFALLSPKSRIDYPEVLILEYAADHPGDLDYLIKIARPDVAVVTAVGEIPVHSEFYSSTNEVVREKAKLVKAIKGGGVVILNTDDERVLGMREMTEARVRTFGFSNKADLKISDFKNVLVGGFPKGVSFSLRLDRAVVRVSLRGVVGKTHAWACTAGVAVGLVSGLTLDESAGALKEYAATEGRGRIIDGINGAVIIDETYNASPDSMRVALEALQGLRVKRRIAVLGDMLELGRRNEKAHREVGSLAAQSVDTLITVGMNAKLIAKEAEKNGLDKNKIFSFENSLDAADQLKKIISQGDVILIKGSQSIRTEKIVKEVMLRPAEAKSLLARQYGKWLKN